MFAFFSPSRVLPLAAAHLPLSSSALLAPFSSSLRRLYKFLFKRLLGQLVSPADVDLASLDVHLSSGDVHLRSLHLHPALLTASSASLPLTLTSATIEHVHAHLPWTQLLTQPCTLHLRGLKVTLTPRTRRGAGEEEDGGGEGDGQGLASSVLGALSESLQSLDPGDLREHLLMQQQLTESLTRESRHAQVVDEREKRTAERERGRKTAVGQEAEQRQPLLGSSDAERSSADRSGGTAAAAGGEIGVSGSSASPLFPPDVDLASAGLQVVASFLERLVSTTELSMEGRHHHHRVRPPSGGGAYAAPLPPRQLPDVLRPVAAAWSGVAGLHLHLLHLVLCLGPCLSVPQAGVSARLPSDAE